MIAGEGPLRAELESDATALGIAGRVRFLGFVNQSQLPAVYTSADLMVLPSEYEPFAVVVNEAMCCGCPVSVSDHVGAARDLVAPVRQEFVFPCGDIAALTAILKDAVVDRSRLAALGRAAVAHIKTWSPERNIAATLEAIEIAVARKGRRTGATLSDSSAGRKPLPRHRKNSANEATYLFSFLCAECWRRRDDRSVIGWRARRVALD